MAANIDNLPFFCAFTRRFIAHLIWIGFVCIALQGYAFQHPVKKDSLRTLLEITTDSTRVNVLNTLAKQYWMGQADSAQLYAKEALNEARKIHYLRGEAEALRIIGFSMRGNYTQFKTYIVQAIQIFEQIGDKPGLAAALNNLGLIEGDNGHFVEGLEALNHSLALFRQIGNQEAIGSVLNYIGINYQNQGNYEKAIEYCLQSLQIRQKLQDHPGIAFSLINMGNMYLTADKLQQALEYYKQSLEVGQDKKLPSISYSLHQVGITYMRLGQYQEALSYLKQLLELNPTNTAALTSIGNVYFHMKEYETSLQYLLKSLALLEKHQADKYDYTYVLTTLSKVNAAQKHYTKALTYAQQSFKFAQQIGARNESKDAAQALSEIYAGLGDYNKAYEYQRLFIALKDSITSQDYSRRLAVLEANLDVAKKQAHIEELTKEQQLHQQEIKRQAFLRNVYLTGLGLLLLLGFVGFRNISLKRKSERLQKERLESELVQAHEMEKAYKLLGQQKEELQATLEDLQTTQTQLIQKEKMASLGELTAGIAHEIQNPLNFVNNFSEVSKELLEELKQEVKTGNEQDALSIAEDLTQNLEKIAHHGKRADSIVKGMLQHSRASSGEKQLTDINALVDEYLRLAYHGLRAKEKDFNADFKLEADPTLGKLEVVPQEIGRVLLNLFNNAFYATSQKKQQLNGQYQPEVRVSTKVVGDKVEIRVKDNGTGIPESVKSKIFQPFFTTKPTGEGTGLGLSLSYDIITKGHGGELKVESKEGEFTEMIIELPKV
jgi:two-component system, NtrC family, sensor kinase